MVLPPTITRDDCFGIIKPSLDAHTLGIEHTIALLKECKLQAYLAPADVADAAAYPARSECSPLFYDWLKENRITRLCYSYRLDPADAVESFNYMLYLLQKESLLASQGGPLKCLYFAGLPAACTAIAEKYPGLVVTFGQRESDAVLLTRLGLPDSLLPAHIGEEHPYDRNLTSFGQEIIKDEAYKDEVSPARAGYENYGTDKDTLDARIDHCRSRGNLPLLRVHAGPYHSDHREAVHEFIKWAKILKDSGFIDILSIGTSQRSQANFGEEWGDQPDGGGVPINSIEDYERIYLAARPMLVRTYAGTKNIPAMARIYEEAINMAWHALSLWWFCRLDGRGPYTLQENLQQHYETLRFIAGSGKPYEPNVSHHFAFRGSDDITYLLSALLAARLAKKLGVRYLVLQNMLNTPRQTWAIHDLAKARALLGLVKNLENKNFKVFYQPRAGLDYFSSDLDTARVQLAAVSALVDDVEPGNHYSPDIIHVVTYSEGSHLATPETIIDSAKITRYSLKRYRDYRKKGYLELDRYEAEIANRAEELIHGVKILLNSIETNLPDPYSPAGLYQIFAAGYLPTPRLWQHREYFTHAVRWQSKIIKGGVKIVDDEDNIISPEKLAFFAEKNLQYNSNYPTGGEMI